MLNGDWWLAGLLLKEIRDGRLYKAKCEPEDRVALLQSPSAEVMMATIQGELGRRDVSNAELKSRTREQQAARVLLLWAHEIVAGKRPVPEVEKAPDLYFAFRIVEDYHRRPSVAFHPTVNEQTQKTRCSYIYFIQAEGTPFVKIGISQGHRSRLATLQTGCPHKLRLLGTCPGNSTEEAALHERFGHLRERGEWFRLERELQLFLGDLERPVL